MLRGYDLNSADHILKDEESHFPLNHLNPRVQNLDSYHHYLHAQHPGHYVGVRRGSSGSPPSPNHGKKGKYMADPRASVSLKPIYLPRPTVTNTLASSNHSNSPTLDSGRLVSQSLYPYNLGRLSPSERNRVFFQKRIPGGANILVNDAWMVLPLDPTRRSSCYSCTSTHDDHRCEGCRRHSCPVDPPAETMDRASSSSRGSRDSYTNNNSRNESNHNQIMNLNNQKERGNNQRSTSPSKKSNNNNNKFSNENPPPPQKSSAVNDVTDTKL